MRLLIYEFQGCDECLYIASDSSESLCTNPLKTGIECPIDKVKGTSKKILMMEIARCVDCPYFKSKDKLPNAHCALVNTPFAGIATGIHFLCPLEKIDPTEK